MLIIGPHVSKDCSNSGGNSSSMKDAIELAISNAKNQSDIDIKAIAIFIAGPRNYSETLLDEDKYYISKLNLEVYVHNTYVSVPWSNSTRAINSIRHQLGICELIKAKGFIIHLPKNDIDNVISILPKLYRPGMSTRIYLEIPAIKPCNAIFHRTDILNELFSHIKDIDPTMSYFGLCIDTAHLWSCGTNISDYKSAELWINELDIDPKYILIHCNDNEKQLGIAPDEHRALAQGRIWENYKDNIIESGLYAFIKYATENNIPVILERKPAKLLFNDYVIIQQLI